jgi:hypothetical protein
MNFTYKQLYVAHYEQGKKRLVVELYDMGAPGEAYGAFTLDVNGKPEQIGNESLLSESALRLWKGQYFVNVYDASAGAVTEEGTAEIARAIAARIALAGEKPKLLAMLPAQLKPSKTRYFHRAGTFNEIYYVSTKNVLELSEKTEGVWAECELGTSKVKVALIRYPDPATCDKAWQAFCVTVFPKPGAGSSSTGPDSIYVEQVENSCTGIRKLSGAGGQPLLGFCFEAGNQEQCAKVLQSLGASGGGQAQ